MENNESYDNVNPNHYKLFPIETIDMMINIWGVDKVISYCEITAFKYKMRVGSKPTASVDDDIKKAEWYLNKAEELKDLCYRDIDFDEEEDIEETEETEDTETIQKPEGRGKDKKERKRKKYLSDWEKREIDNLFKNNPRLSIQSVAKRYDISERFAYRLRFLAKTK